MLTHFDRYQQFRKAIRILSLCFCIQAGFVANVHSQVTQATVVTTFNPPYTIPLSDLYTTQQLRVMITAIDGPIPSGKIGVTIQGDNGIAIQNNYIASPLSIDIGQGAPHLLENGEVDELFQPGSFTATGITVDEAFNQGLPPGNYDFCFRVYVEGRTGWGPISPAPPSGCVSIMIASTPVMVTTLVQPPPFTFDFAEYAYKINATLLSSNSRNIRLFLSVKGDNGITIRSRDGIINRTAISLQAGLPFLLNPIDLEPYLRTENLVFSGVTPDLVSQRGLPEGNYRFCVRAVDLTGNFVSGDDPVGCSNMVSLRLFEPPQLIGPQCGVSIKETAAPNIIFTWTPSPGAPPTTPYTLRIVEMTDPAKDPNDALFTATTPAFFEETIIGVTTFLYGPAQPVLEPGRKYAWQVVAGLAQQDLDLANSTKMFRNNGRSSACSFMYDQKDSTKLKATVALVDQNSLKDVPGSNSPNAYGALPQSAFIYNSIVTGKLNYRFLFGESQPLANTNIKLVVAYALQQGEKITIFTPDDKDHGISKYKDMGKVLATTKTNDEGNFTFFSILTDKDVYSVLEANPIINIESGKASGGSSVYKTARIIVENPYLLSPNDNVKLTQGETISIGDIQAVVREYVIKINLKSEYAVNDILFKEAEIQLPLNNYDVYVLRQTRPLGVPANEGILDQPHGQKKGMEVVSKGTTDKYGAVAFLRMVKNIGPNDKYFLYAETKAENLTNFKCEPTPFAFNYDKTPAQYKVKQLGGPAKDDGTFISDYALASVGFTLPMLSEPGEITGFVKRGDNPTQGLPNAQVKLWEVPKSENIILHLLFKQPKYTATSSASSGTGIGYFKIGQLLPEAEMSNDKLVVIGPYRYLRISKYGFNDYKEPFPKIMLGERVSRPDILMMPKGSIVGDVVNEENNPLTGEVSIQGGMSVQTAAAGFVTQKSGMGLNIIVPTKSSFEVIAPLGNQKLSVVPTNGEAYLSYDTTINVTKDKQSAGVIKLYDKAFRIRVLVSEYTNNSPGLYVLNTFPGGPKPKPSSKKFIQNAKVAVKYLSAAPVLTNSKGLADLKFVSAGEDFVIEVESPDDQLYEFATATISKNQLPAPSKDFFEVEISLKKAARVSGKVMVGNSPIAGAKVFVNSSGDGKQLMADTDETGHYELKNVPMNIPLEIWAVKGQSQYIGDVKKMTFTNQQNENVDFVLTQYNNMVLTELLGIPIEVQELHEQGDHIILTGAFITLPLGKGLTLFEEGTTLPFSEIELIKSDIKNSQGINYGKPLSGKVIVDKSQLDMVLNSKLVLHQRASEEFLVVADNGQGKGVLESPTFLDISTFQVSSVDFNANELRLATGTGSEQKLNVRTISASGESTTPKYYVVSSTGKNLSFKFHGFATESKNDNSFIDVDKLSLRSTIHTNLKNITPADIKLDIGDIIITQNAIGDIVNKPGFNIPIDKWKLDATKWSVSNSGFIIQDGTLKTGVVDVPFTGLTVFPDKLHDNAKYDLTNISLSNIVTLNVSGNVSVGFDNSKNKWSVMMTPKNDSYAAITTGLPVIKSNEGFWLESVALLSDGSANLMIDKKSPGVTLYDLAAFDATGIQVTQDAVSIVGQMDLKMAQVGKVPGGIVYTKQGGKIVGAVLPAAIGFTANAVSVNFPTTGQKFSPGKFEALGTVGEGGKFQFNVKLSHTKALSRIEITPGQSYVMTPGKKSELKNLAGKMEVNNNKWKELFFEGDLTGTEGASGRLGFTVKGDWVASDQQIGIKNVPSSFGGIALTYNFEEKRLEGSLHYDKQISSSQQIQGDATAIVDQSGWHFVSTGALTMTNPKMEGQAGLLFGDYPMTPDIRERFESSSFVYQKAGHLPDIFPGQVKGYFFEGGASLPIPILPNFDFDFGLISGHFYVNVGGDVRTKMEFAQGATIGVGSSIFAEAGVGIGGSVVIACAGCSASALAMLNFDGQVSTNGNWFVDGEGFFKVTGSTYRGWGVCDSDCDGMLCDKSSESASIMIGANAHYGTDYKKLEFFLK